MGSIPGSGRSPSIGNGNPLQCSCLENSTDRGAIVHGAARSQMQLRTDQSLIMVKPRTLPLCSTVNKSMNLIQISPMALRMSFSGPAPSPVSHVIFSHHVSLAVLLWNVPLPFFVFLNLETFEDQWLGLVTCFLTIQFRSCILGENIIHDSVLPGASCCESHDVSVTPLVPAWITC